jgi:hypothetical protein
VEDVGTKAFQSESEEKDWTSLGAQVAGPLLSTIRILSLKLMACKKRLGRAGTGDSRRTLPVSS